MRSEMNTLDKGSEELQRSHIGIQTRKGHFANQSCLTDCAKEYATSHVLQFPT